MAPRSDSRRTASDDCEMKAKMAAESGFPETRQKAGDPLAGSGSSHGLSLVVRVTFGVPVAVWQAYRGQSSPGS